jgi:site-specific DNA recombinase
MMDNDTHGTTDTPRKRCAIYTLASTLEDEDASTTSTQRETCEAWLRSRASPAWELLPTRFDDEGQSGPGLERLLAEVESGRVDVVLVDRLVRLSKSLVYDVWLLGCLADRGVVLICASENLSTADRVGRFAINVLIAFAELERTRGEPD